MFEETGVGIRDPLWFVGVVENRNDPRKEGRVQVRAFGVHGTNAQIPTERLPWALCIAGSYDPNYPIPPLNSWVFGFFIDGRDAQQPMILGLIPTQMTSLVDPEKNGWGVIPSQNVNLDAQGSRATDFGQPQNSRRARGEEIHNTGVLLQEVNRLDADFSTAVEGLVVQEPPPAYNAQYPYNRVIETASGHTIELDDSPGGNRITIFHNKGAFIEIDHNGTMNIKSVGDMHLGSMKNIVIIADGRQLVKVKGDATISVDGNMLQEVNGDMQQIVRGNYELSVAGQLNLNGSEEIQARAAKVRLESNVEGINLKSAKKINLQSGEVINIKSGQGIFQEAAEDINIKGDNLFVEGAGTTNIKSADIILDSGGNMSLKGDHVIAGGGQLVSINASTVAIDDVVQLANGMAGSPLSADSAITASPAESTELPEPATKSAGNGGSGGHVGGSYQNPSIGGGGGYISADDFNAGDTPAGAGGAGGSFSEPLNSSYTQGALTPLLDLIGRAEGAGYDTIVGYVRKADYPSKPITQMTISEILAWQESIDGKYDSEAIGRYQIMEDTLRGFDNNRSGSSGGVSLYERAGLTLNSLFSAANQDLMATELLKYRGLNRFLSGSLTEAQFGDNLAYEWASLPLMIGPNAGKGKYSGQGGKITTKEVLDALKKVKEYKDQATSAPGRL